MTRNRKPPKPCKDCPEGTTRKTPYPGPRCATHHRVFKAAQKQRTRARYLKATYNLPLEDYEALYAFQGGKCAQCKRATGRTRALSVDHDHACCPSPPTCGECTRGLLCGPCNDMFGHGRDDPKFFLRAADYLTYNMFQRWKDHNGR